MYLHWVVSGVLAWWVLNLGGRGAGRPSLRMARLVVRLLRLVLVIPPCMIGFYIFRDVGEEGDPFFEVLILWLRSDGDYGISQFVVDLCSELGGLCGIVPVKICEKLGEIAVKFEPSAIVLA